VAVLAVVGLVAVSLVRSKGLDDALDHVADEARVSYADFDVATSAFGSEGCVTVHAVQGAGASITRGACEFG
jgi:hypothetical protein